MTVKKLMCKYFSIEEEKDGLIIRKVNLFSVMVQSTIYLMIGTVVLALFGGISLIFTSINPIIIVAGILSIGLILNIGKILSGIKYIFTYTIVECERKSVKPVEQTVESLGGDTQ